MALLFDIQIIKVAESSQKNRANRYQIMVNGSMDPENLSLYKYRLLNPKGLAQTGIWLDYQSVMVWINRHMQDEPTTFQIQVTLGSNVDDSTGRIIDQQFFNSTVFGEYAKPWGFSGSGLGFLMFK